MTQIGRTRRLMAILALVAITIAGGLAIQDAGASARGENQAFMGNWETDVVSLNEDSWVFGGPSLHFAMSLRECSPRTG